MGSGRAIASADWLLSAVVGATDVVVFAHLVSHQLVRVSCRGGRPLVPSVHQNTPLSGMSIHIVFKEVPLKICCISLHWLN